MAKKKTWEQKFNVNFEPRVETSDKDFAGVRTGEKMLIPTPALIDDYIRQMPEGSTADAIRIRKDLAANFHADTTCPLTTGIFLRIVAERALEKLNAGEDSNNITPFWRVIDQGSPTAKKLSCGISFIEKQRSKEEKNKIKNG